MAWHLERELTPSARSSSAARSLTADWLDDVLDPAAQDTKRAVDEAILIVSELVTNAVQANTHELRLRLSLVASDPALLTISVEDDAPGTPELATGPLTRSRGRGLLLVDALARSWGTRWTPGCKAVWAEIAIAANRPWPGQNPSYRLSS